MTGSPGPPGIDRRTAIGGIGILAGLQSTAAACRSAARAIRAGDVLQPPIIRRRFEDVGVRSGARADPVANSRALAAALRPGTRLEATAGAFYPVSTAIRIPDGAALTASYGAEPPVIHLPARYFGRRDGELIEGRYAADAVGIDCSGSEDGGHPSRDILLSGFVLDSEQVPGRSLRGVVARNAVNFRMEGVTVRGLPLGIGICLASIRGDSALVDVTVRDFYDDSMIWRGSPPQSTGIEIDNDIVAGIASAGLRIDRPHVHDIATGARFRARFGPQTDGINIVSPRTSGLRITRPRIARVEEGIDMFGCDAIIEDIEIEDCGTFGLKFIHGAARTIVRRGAVRNSGLSGLVLAGSGVAGTNTADNRFERLTIEAIDPSGRWAENSTACVRIDGGQRGRVCRNVVSDCRLEPGAHGRYAWLDLSEAGAGNRGERLVIGTGSNVRERILIRNGGSVVTEAA